MRRGTTPTHTFRLPFDVSELQEVKITYSQCGNEVLHKKKADCTLDGTTLQVILSQEETLKFECCYPAQVQVRALMTNGQAVAADPVDFAVEEILDNEVLA